MLEKVKKLDLKNWRGVGIYILFIFLTAPWLPAIIRQTAKWSAIDLTSFLTYIRVTSLAMLALVIILYMFISQCYKNIFSWFITILVGGGFAFLTTRTAAAAEVTHFLEYGGLSVYIFYKLDDVKNLPYPFERYYKAAFFSLLVGVADELYQGLLPTRYYDINDIMLNVVSAVLGLIFIWGTLAQKPAAVVKCPA
ncbi:MAG: VanZ family protein [Candidatus Schekmanbacteria bacterium]|nr:VanZ family protein [Candidatus Schekmanbacteria bacterium]